MNCWDNHKDLEYCETVGRRVPNTYCVICRGTKMKTVSKQEIRDKYRNELTADQKKDYRTVSVVIPCVVEDFQYLERTIDSLYENAVGPIEVIVAFDGFEPKYYPMNIKHIVYTPALGQRVAFNQMVKQADGEFIFRLDTHCTMSPGWDARMKASCKEGRVICTAIDRLVEETWEGEGRDAGMWCFHHNLKLMMIVQWKPIIERALEEEVMTSMGQAFMICKDYYWKLGGSDERMGTYGEMGVEWSLKPWLTGGKVIMRTDVLCCHLFRPKGIGIRTEGDFRIEQANLLWNEWIIGDTPVPFTWLLDKFDRYAKWGKDAKLFLQMHRLSPYVRRTDNVPKKSWNEMSEMPGQDSKSAVESKCQNSQRFSIDRDD